MPRELIVIPGQPGGGDSGVVVQWGRGASVELATLRPDGDDPSGSSGQYLDLSRHDINRLIQHLRRARDQAYGRDE